MANRAPKERAFWVQTTQGVFQEGFEDSGLAMQDCVSRNERAQALGIQARYEFIPNPSVKS